MNLFNQILLIVIFFSLELVNAKGTRTIQPTTSSYYEEQEVQPQSEKIKKQKKQSSMPLNTNPTTYKERLDYIKQLNKNDILKNQESNFTDEFKKFILDLLLSTELNQTEKDALIEAAIIRNITWTGTKKDIQTYWNLRKRIIEQLEAEKKRIPKIKLEL